jgi:hypothetical protein
MDGPPIGDALDMFQRATTRFSRQLRTVSDGSQRVRHLDWTISETGAHVLGILRGYRDLAGGGPPIWPDLEHGDDHNAALLAATPERDPRRVADAIDQVAPGLGAVWAAHAGEALAWHAGLTVPVASITAMVANDVLIHGWDLATTVGQAWPIAGPDSVVAVRGLSAVLPAFVDPVHAAGVRITYRIALRGGPVMTWSFDDGTLTVVEGAAARPDCRVSAAPTAWNLSGYGRLPAWKAALTGQVVVYGRRPWLISKVNSLLRRA